MIRHILLLLWYHHKLLLLNPSEFILLWVMIRQHTIPSGGIRAGCWVRCHANRDGNHKRVGSHKGALKPRRHRHRFRSRGSVGGEGAQAHGRGQNKRNKIRICLEAGCLSRIVRSERIEISHAVSMHVTRGAISSRIFRLSQRRNERGHSRGACRGFSHLLLLLRYCGCLYLGWTWWDAALHASRPS